MSIPATTTTTTSNSITTTTTTTTSSSSASSLITTTDPTNQHLAILLPKHLWKPDSLASHCDNFYCRIRFNLLERRHHCRKCGGIFCASCTSRSTPLLDAASLAFLQPPRNIPLAKYESPSSPISQSRVCDDCWDQIHGLPSTPRTPDLIRSTATSFTRILSSPISMLRSSPSSSSTPNSSLTSSVDIATAVPSSILATAPPLTRRKSPSLRTAPSISSLNGPRRSAIRSSHLNIPPDLDRSYGELDAYPLRRSSVLCKATGGGRWVPKHDPPLIGYRPPIPGAKAEFELEMEHQERLERKRRENPVVKDGEFQYRFFPRQHEPLVLSRSPYTMSTF